MPSELIVTSAPKGLLPGTYGFCAVACSREMNETTMRSLESISGYRHIEGSIKPVVYSHYLYEISGVKKQIISRIADAGFDYSRRTNKIAHHLVLSGSEVNALPSGPAALCATRGIFTEKWNDSEPPRYLDSRVLNNPFDIPARSIPNGEWKRVAGDAGWAGALASTVKSKRPVALIVRPEQNVLLLFQEALALLPPEERWKATFSTFFTNAPPAAICQWKALVAGAYDAKVLSDSRALVLDLTESKLGSVEQFGDTSLFYGAAKTLVDAARSGRTTAPTSAFQSQAPLPHRPQPKDLNVFYSDSRPEVNIEALIAQPQEDGIYNVLEDDRTPANERTTISKNNYQDHEDEDYDDAKNSSLGQWIFVSVLLVVVLGAIIAVAVMLAKIGGGQKDPQHYATEESQYPSTQDFRPKTERIESTDESQETEEEKTELIDSEGKQEEITEKREDEKPKDEKSEEVLLEGDTPKEEDEEESLGEGIEGNPNDETNNELNINVNNHDTLSENPEDGPKDEGIEEKPRDFKDEADEFIYYAKIVYDHFNKRQDWDSQFEELTNAKKQFDDLKPKLSTVKSEDVNTILNLHKRLNNITLDTNLYERWNDLQCQRQRINESLNEINRLYDTIAESEGKDKERLFKSLKNCPLFDANFTEKTKQDFLSKALRIDNAKKGLLNQELIETLKSKTEKSLTNEETELVKNARDHISNMTRELEKVACLYFIKQINKGFLQIKDIRDDNINQVSIATPAPNQGIKTFAYICSSSELRKNTITLESANDDVKIRLASTESTFSKTATAQMIPNSSNDEREGQKYEEDASFEISFTNTNELEDLCKLTIRLRWTPKIGNSDQSSGTVSLTMAPLSSKEDLKYILQSLSLKWVTSSDRENPANSVVNRSESKPLLIESSPGENTNEAKNDNDETDGGKE